MDDPCNVHGTYARLHSILDNRSAMFVTGHEDQHGVGLAFPGDSLGFFHSTNFSMLGEAVVRSVELLPEGLQKIEFEKKFPSASGNSIVIENLSANAGLEVRNCRTGPNRARGYLVSTRGKVVLENNHIEAAAAGLKISGDANYWYESGPVEDVLIRGNTFGNCCYGPQEWGRAVIDIDPEIEDPWSLERPYHRNIVIRDNSFKTYDNGILFARSVEGLEFSGNRIDSTGDYTPQGRLPALVNVEACRDLVIKNNLIDPAIDCPLLEEHDQSPGFPRVQAQHSLESLSACVLSPSTC